MVVNTGNSYTWTIHNKSPSVSNKEPSAGSLVGLISMEHFGSVEGVVATATWYTSNI